MSQENTKNLSLRERKKAKTRAIIQKNALRLIQEQGYTNTTVEHIAEASEISPSTFFRYFPTKESVVLEDDFDPLLIESFQKQPKELSAIAAFRAAVKEGFNYIPDAEMKALRLRMELIMSVPDLRLASYNQLIGTGQMISKLVAERVGRDVEDPAIYTFSGTLMGAIISATVYTLNHPEKDFVEVIDQALEQLDAGVPF